jgi:hypothetical protein
MQTNPFADTLRSQRHPSRFEISKVSPRGADRGGVVIFHPHRRAHAGDARLGELTATLAA